MESKEIIAILAAVVAVCLIIAVGQTIRGTEDSSEASVTTVSTTQTSATTDIWDKLREENASKESTMDGTDYGSESVVPYPEVSGDGGSGLIILGTDSAASSTTSTSATAVTPITSTETIPETFIINQ